MNIESISKALNQKYIKDIDNSAGRVGPYYFIIEPTNQRNLIRISFNIKESNLVLNELEEAMSVHRAVGRDGVRSSGIQLFIECKLSGLEDEEELATILEKVANILHDAELKQVDGLGKEGSNLGVFRVGTKLEIQTDDAIEDITDAVGARFDSSNQSRVKAYLSAIGIFFLISPLYMIVRMFEPSIMGFVIFSFMVLIGMFNRSINAFLKHWTPSKLDLVFLLLFYVFGIYTINMVEALLPIIIEVFKSGQGDRIFILLRYLIPSVVSMSGGLFFNSMFTLAFAIAFNYHIVRQLLDISDSRVKPVKRSIHRVL